MIAQAVIKKPLFPALVHDDTTRIIILSVILIICIVTLYHLIKRAI
jgi:hypothetical protein